MKYLEMIQNVISRMASNSFALKGWAVALVSGVFVLSSKDSNALYFLIAYVPIVFFWVLDSYYLLQERLYRSLYSDAEKGHQKPFDMIASYSKYGGTKNSFLSCFTSLTEVCFYLPLAIIVAIVVLLSCS